MEAATQLDLPVVPDPSARCAMTDLLPPSPMSDVPSANRGDIHTTTQHSSSAYADCVPRNALCASATLSASVTLPVIGVELADIYADGAPHLLIAYADSTVDVLWLSAGADPLHRAASFRLDPAGASARWLGFSAGAGVDDGYIFERLQNISDGYKTYRYCEA